MRDQEVYLSPLTPLSYLRRAAWVFRDKPAVFYGSRQETYAEFAWSVNRLAGALRAWGLQKDDRVAYLCPNTPPMLEAHFAVPLAGGVLVTINTRLAAGEIRYILNHSGARVLFVDTEFSPLVQSIGQELEALELVVEIRDLEAETPEPAGLGPTYDEFLWEAGDEPVEPVLDSENDTLAINYTSGTTGEPKGVMFSHRGAYLNALGNDLEWGVNSSSVHLWTVPMFHCNGWCQTWGVTAVGGAHVCLRRVDVPKIVALIEQHGVTHLCGAPTVLIMLANDPAFRAIRLERPLRIITGGAPPSPTIIQTMEEIGVTLEHIYGLTETYGPHSICEWQAPWDALPLAERARMRARQGVPYVHASEMRVVDSDMNEVPADGKTMGEVVMRGNNVMKGYFRRPESTAEAFQGGWFHSGDIAVLHPDGYIELCDRAKDIIVSGGENISTIEVERVIYQHPAVLEVSVIAIPDSKWGEVPKAFVTLKAGGQLTEPELIAFCRERLSHFKCPRAAEFGPLPKTSTGKIQKYKLREKEWVGYEKRIH